MSAHRCAVVTGSADGLGLGVTRRLLADGWCVVAADISDAVGELFPAGSHDGRVRAVVADIAAPDTADALVRTAMASYGRIDAVVNNAGVGGPSGDLDAVEMADVERTLEVNLLGPVRLCRAVIPFFKAQGSGRIANVGSLFADAPVVGGSAYIMSKAALRSLTHCLALELGPSGVTVNTVAPGYMMTKMHEEEVAAQASTAGVDPDEQLRRLRARVPLGRHGDGGDVAGAVAWLLSDDAGYVTGQTIGVNGGVQVS
ncbi:NAD(P)-dependent dehydrogenase (short-subunit alcohol dehydrogenase family) [Mycobacterium frederiksbergense]|uniref:NAD(P)-dependent dehydrogenase (Short-subunit alcohol dehydrogenase family) n=1 Tax=Mycolicibacterium frederiksbergense TaxID=117567 RepID=A0ABT6L394_9MYCO|nr:SDR family oxidoreductase [Mycolicibacterium frederiksbergense]MDH6197388.1 NAD(P)-dependent dehydrogenase (short-subunit alcohol dehydrogenase family) [Mycolicibacterium frederiksbergense]